MESAERLLRNLGFSTYEARAIVALARKHPANGEVGKLAGIPSSKVYSVLEGLKNGGFIVAESVGATIRYESVPIGEIAAKLRSAHDGAVETLEAEFSRIAPLSALELSWNVPDYTSVIDRMRRVLSEARSSAMLSIWPEEVAAIYSDIEAALARSIRVVVASFGPAEGLAPRR
jgi:sugar-specific transcriptional regulator TrmB